MFKNWQDNIEFYLSYFSENRLLQALIVFICFWALAWILDRFVISFIRRLTIKTKITYDDQLLSFLHHPLHTSVILIGLASATLVLNPGELLQPFIFTILKMLALLV